MNNVVVSITIVVFLGFSPFVSSDGKKKRWDMSDHRSFGIIATIIGPSFQTEPEEMSSYLRQELGLPDNGDISHIVEALVSVSSEMRHALHDTYVQACTASHDNKPLKIARRIDQQTDKNHAMYYREFLSRLDTDDRNLFTEFVRSSKRDISQRSFLEVLEGKSQLEQTHAVSTTCTPFRDSNHAH